MALSLSEPRPDPHLLPLKRFALHKFPPVRLESPSMSNPSEKAPPASLSSSSARNVSSFAALHQPSWSHNAINSPRESRIACSKFLVDPRLVSFLYMRTGNSARRAKFSNRANVSSCEPSSHTTSSAGWHVWDAMLSNCSVKYREPLYVHNATEMEPAPRESSPESPAITPPLRLRTLLPARHHIVRKMVPLKRVAADHFASLDPGLRNDQVAPEGQCYTPSYTRFVASRYALPHLWHGSRWQPSPHSFQALMKTQR